MQSSKSQTPDEAARHVAALLASPPASDGPEPLRFPREEEGVWLKARPGSRPATEQARALALAASLQLGQVWAASLLVALAAEAVARLGQQTFADLLTDLAQDLGAHARPPAELPPAGPAASGLELARAHAVLSRYAPSLQALLADQERPLEALREWAAELWSAAVRADPERYREQGEAGHAPEVQTALRQTEQEIQARDALLQVARACCWPCAGQGPRTVEERGLGLALWYLRLAEALLAVGVASGQSQDEAAGALFRASLKHLERDLLPAMLAAMAQVFQGPYGLGTEDAHVLAARLADEIGRLGGSSFLGLWWRTAVAVAARRVQSERARLRSKARPKAERPLPNPVAWAEGLARHAAALSAEYDLGHPDDQPRVPGLAGPEGELDLEAPSRWGQDELDLGERGYDLAPNPAQEPRRGRRGLRGYLRGR